jgi:hypothetical protein
MQILKHTAEYTTALFKWVKEELYHYMPWRHFSERMYNSYLFLMSALDVGE